MTTSTPKKSQQPRRRPAKKVNPVPTRLVGPRARTVTFSMFDYYAKNGKRSQFDRDRVQRGGERPGDIVNLIWARTLVLVFTAQTDKTVETVETVETLRKNAENALTSIQTLLHEASDPPAVAKDLVDQAKLLMNDIVPELTDDEKAGLVKDLDQCPFSYPDPWKIK